MDLVFPNGIPRASRLRVDAERNGIEYQDGLGRYADFHALRYTFATFLQRYGVPLRFAMKLMRHNDMKLTAKHYADETQFPIYDSIKDIPIFFGRPDSATSGEMPLEAGSGGTAVAGRG